MVPAHHQLPFDDRSVARSPCRVTLPHRFPSLFRAADATARGESGTVDTDGSLLARARCDDEVFSTLLYARYAERVYWYCDLRLGNRELAEDMDSQGTLAAVPWPSLQQSLIAPDGRNVDDYTFIRIGGGADAAVKGELFLLRVDATTLNSEAERRFTDGSSMMILITLAG